MAIAVTSSDVENEIGYGRTPLHLAAKNEAIKALLREAEATE